MPEKRRDLVRAFRARQHQEWVAEPPSLPQYGDVAAPDNTRQGLKPRGIRGGMSGLWIRCAHHKKPRPTRLIPQGPARKAGTLGYKGRTHPSERVGTRLRQNLRKSRFLVVRRRRTPRNDSVEEGGILRLRVPTEIVRTRFPEAKGSGRCAQNDNAWGSLRAQARVPVARVPG